MCFSRKKNFETVGIELRINGSVIKSVPNGRFSGIQCDSKLNFYARIRNLQLQTSKALNILKFIRSTWTVTNPQTMLAFYTSYILSILDYGSFVYYPCNNKAEKYKLEKIQYAAIRIAMGYRNSTPTNVLLWESKLVSFENRTMVLGSVHLSKLS